MAHGKVYRYIFIENHPRFHVLITMAIGLVAVLEMITLSYIREKIQEGEERKALIVQIPEMESILYPNANRPTLISKEIMEPLTLGKKKYSLKGVQELNGKLSALINEDVYQVGDVLEGYRITRIMVDSVLFKKDSTNDIKMLRLGN
jgi:hypothetical protein